MNARLARIETLLQAKSEQTAEVYRLPTADAG